MPLKPAVSAIARNKRDFANTTLEDVKKAARSIENQLAARQSLRNMRRLMPLFRGLEHYSKVVDILCNGTPYLPWIWAPITLILRVASEFVEAFEQIIRGYASIAESLRRFEILSDTFINEPDFQQTLAVFYADILKFHKHAYKFVRRSSWKLMFTTSWGRFQARFGNILADLKQHGALIDLEANARDISQSKAMRNDIRKWREESENRVSQEDIEQNAKQYESIVSWLQVNEGDQIAIMDSTTSQVADYQDTCGWLLKNKKVSSWANSQPDTPALWLKGPAGTGKSVLTTQLVNFMRGTKFVIYHFCTYRYVSSTMYEQVLKSLLLQIIQKDGDLVAHVYKTCILEKKQPTTASLEQLLQNLLASLSSDPNKAEYLWIVIDGLDECDPDKHMRLVRLVNQLTSKPVVPGSTVCKVLISSRAPSNALERLKRSQVISLNEEKKLLSEAIRQYVDRRLRLMDKKLRQLDLEHSDMKEIEDVIVIKAEGINIFFSGDEIKHSVKQLPQKLGDFYQRILTQILIQLDARSLDRIKCVFGWIAFAKRPLRKLELLSAIALSAGDPSVSRLAPQFLLEICALQQHGAATVTCLLSGLNVFCHTYAEQDRALRVAKGLHGLHVYATEFWTEYLLSWAASEYPRAEGDSVPLLDITCKLAASLNISPATTIPNPRHLDKMLDKRLQFLEKYPVLLNLVNQALQARSLDSLESRVLQNKMLASYQEVVKSLLDQNYYPELSTDEFELFKIHFGATTEELLKEHEKCHIRWFQCTFPGCQFPSFVSTRALKSHTRKHHTVTVTAKAIRRPGTGTGTPIWNSRKTNEQSLASFDPIGEDQTHCGRQPLPILRHLPPRVTISSDRTNAGSDTLFDLDVYAYPNGNLKNYRQYELATFILTGHGDTWFMFSKQCHAYFHTGFSRPLYHEVFMGRIELYQLSTPQRQELVHQGILSWLEEESTVQVVMATALLMIYGHQAIKDLIE
ncbi:hypothetical protein BKA59DRAFT_529143 [Fusarium tricinctum]|uniref:NACHT domain-containing protein n=1 Tax=Fusarium tricinctum TaxID=61284 RepID=A0A8K0WAT3_9HYPO|nr:hypothetical protein BKA59DRAFT_529143 [Fusarium tricinctum]